MVRRETVWRQWQILNILMMQCFRFYNTCFLELQASVWSFKTNVGEVRQKCEFIAADPPVQETGVNELRPGLQQCEIKGCWTHPYGVMFPSQLDGQTMFWAERAQDSRLPSGQRHPSSPAAPEHRASLMFSTKMYTYSYEYRKKSIIVGRVCSRHL